MLPHRKATVDHSVNRREQQVTRLQGSQRRERRLSAQVDLKKKPWASCYLSAQTGQHCRHLGGRETF